MKGLSRTGVVLDRETVPCCWVVGADGANSRVRRWAGLDRTRSHSRRLASPPQPNQTVERLHGDSLGHPLPDLRDAHRP